MLVVDPGGGLGAESCLAPADRAVPGVTSVPFFASPCSGGRQGEGVGTAYPVPSVPLVRAQPLVREGDARGGVARDCLSLTSSGLHATPTLIGAAIHAGFVRVTTHLMRDYFVYLRRKR